MTLADCYFGDPGDVPVAGDWHAGCGDEIGVVRGATWYLDNDLGGGAETSFVFGVSGMAPMLGDFDGDGVDTPGYHR